MSCCKYSTLRCYCSKPIKRLYREGDLVRAVIAGTEVYAKLTDEMFLQDWVNCKVVTLSPTTVQLIRG